MSTTTRPRKRPCPTIGMRTIHGERTLLSPEAQTFAQLIAAWKESGQQLPTHSITINLIFDTFMTDGGWPQGRERLLSELRRAFRKKKIPGHYIWIMERGKFPNFFPHLNLLVRLPEDPKFRQWLWRFLVQRFDMVVPPGKKPWHVLNQTGKGNAVCVRVIGAQCMNRKTRRSGMEGVADYLVKEIDRNAFEPGMRARLGDLVGASQEVTKLRTAANFQRPRLRLRKIPLVAAPALLPKAA